MTELGTAEQVVVAKCARLVCFLTLFIAKKAKSLGTALDCCFFRDLPAEKQLIAVSTGNPCFVTPFKNVMEVVCLGDDSKLLLW